VKFLDKKEKLFQATQHLINTKGVSHLTLDNIAKEAGLSKGGLLHYFPNKNALISEAITSILEDYSEGMEELDEKDTNAGHFLRSFTEVSLNNPKQLTSGLLAAMSVNPELLNPIQEHYTKWQNKIEADGLDPITATIIRLAVDGLWFCDLFGLASPEGEFRKEILDKIEELTQREQL